MRAELEPVGSGGVEILEPGPSAVISRSPFDRSVRILPMPAGSSVADAVARTGFSPALQRCVGAYVGDQRIPRELWAKVRPKAGVSVYLRVELGRGGGSGGKNPLRAVLTLALVVAAIWVAGPVAGVLKGLGVSGMALTAAKLATTALVLTAGQALLNQLIPPPKPGGPSSDPYGFDQQPGNPYASLTGLSNRAAPYGPIPRVIGEKRMYPLLAARPYTEMQGNIQYLRMLLLVGYGPLDISDIRIGNTPLSAFPGAQFEIREGWANDAAPTLYTREIQEEALSVLLNPSASNVRNTEPDTTEGSVDITFPNGLCTIDGSGNRVTRTVQFNVEYHDGSTYQPVTWIEGSAYFGTGANGLITATDASAGTVVRSGRFSLPTAAAHSIRVIRTTAAGGSSDIDAAYWTVLRSIKPDNPINMPGLCLIGLRLQATAQLNGTPDTINCLAKSYLPVWDGDSFNYEITRNPAWGALDMFRRRGVTTVMADGRCDIAAFAAWATDCDTTAPNADEPRWTADLVLEGGSIYSAAQTVAGYGRAQIGLVNGKYTPVRDIAQTVPIQHISPRNARGYRGSRSFAKVPHCLRTRFCNPNKEDAEDTVNVYLDGYGETSGGGLIAASDFDTLDLFGCRSSTFAWREARYHLATLKLRRETHSVEMDLDAIRCTKGDLVRLSYDVISIGLGTGRIIARTVSGGTHVTHVVLDNPIDAAADKTYVLRYRQRDGTSVVAPLATFAGVQVDEVEFDDPVPLAEAPDVGDLFFFGETSLESAPMIVKAIEPGPNFSARVMLVDAAAGVHTADTGTIPDFETYISHGLPLDQLAADLPLVTLRSDDTALLRLADGTFLDRIAVAFQPSSPGAIGATHWDVEFRPYGTNGDWDFVGRATVSTRTMFISPVIALHAYDVRARTITRNGTPSDWTVVSNHTVVGKTAPPAPPSGFVVSATLDGVRLSATASPSVDLSHYELRVGGANWAAATVLHDRLPGFPYVIAPYGLSGAVTFRVKAVDVLGLYSTEVTASSPTSNNAAPAATDGTIETGATKNRIARAAGTVTGPVTTPVVNTWYDVATASSEFTGLLSGGKWDIDLQTSWVSAGFVGVDPVTGLIDMRIVSRRTSDGGDVQTLWSDTKTDVGSNERVLDDNLFSNPASGDRTIAFQIRRPYTGGVYEGDVAQVESVRFNFFYFK